MTEKIFAAGATAFSLTLSMFAPTQGAQISMAIVSAVSLTLFGFIFYMESKQVDQFEEFAKKIKRIEDQVQAVLAGRAIGR